MIPSSPDSILTTQFQDPGSGPFPNGALETHFRGLFVLWGGRAWRPRVHLPPAVGSPPASSVPCSSWERLGPLTTWLDQSLSPPWLTGIRRTPRGSSSLKCDCDVGQPTLAARGEQPHLTSQTSRPSVTTFPGSPSAKRPQEGSDDDSCGPSIGDNDSAPLRSRAHIPPAVIAEDTESQDRDSVRIPTSAHPCPVSDFISFPQIAFFWPEISWSSPL